MKKLILSDKDALRIYAKHFPEDAEVAEDASDTRRKDIANEMRGVLAAKTDKLAAEVIAWWDWPEGEGECLRTVRRIRRECGD